MGKIRYLLSNINTTNIILAGALIAIAYFTFSASPSVKVKQRKPAAQKTAAEQKPAEVKKGHQDEKNPFPTDYMVIAEQNLFHPDRKIPEPKDEKQAAAALPKPDFVLDGTLISNDLKMAFMEDRKAPVNTPGRPNRQTSLRVGDSLSGFTLTEIDKDKVVMKRGEEQMVVSLEDPEKDKTRHYSETATAARAGTAPPTRPNIARPPVPARPGAFTPTPSPAAQQQQQQNSRRKFFNIFRSRSR